MIEFARLIHETRSCILDLETVYAGKTIEKSITIVESAGDEKPGPGSLISPLEGPYLLG